MHHPGDRQRDSDKQREMERQTDRERVTHLKLLEELVKTLTRNSPSWLGSKVQGMMT